MGPKTRQFFFKLIMFRCIISVSQNGLEHDRCKLGVFANRPPKVELSLLAMILEKRMPISKTVPKK